MVALQIGVRISRAEFFSRIAAFGQYSLGRAMKRRGWSARYF